jgi:hydroxyethylthiazole kinase-like uncharacterized protein yjeF
VIGRPILTADEMRAAEARVVAAGTSAELLMERAGIAAAEAIWRFAGAPHALILCGPGNNGGDGYVIARELARRGCRVDVAELAEPTTPAAQAAKRAWSGDVVPLAQAASAPLLVDALFGTGLTRGLDQPIQGVLARMAAEARLRVAIDLPSGVATDDGAILSPIPAFDLTITFGALKPAHFLQPAARHMGRIVVADIGVPVDSRLQSVERPQLRRPGPTTTKYTRGLVTIVAGEMPGASALAASAAARSGAGAVRLQSKEYSATVPLSVIQAPGRPLDRISDDRIGAVLAGCGLPANDLGRCLLDEVLGEEHPLILDAGALQLLADSGRERLATLDALAILTPHEGEFAKLFGSAEGNKLGRARDAAAGIGAVVVYKGPDTVIAHPDGRAAIHPAVSNWLATGGSGDILAGVIAAMRAAGMEAFEAACAGVWLHGRAAQLAGPAFIADDLIAQLPHAVASACDRPVVSEEIVRLAGRGDGVTASGRFFPLVAPGDLVDEKAQSLPARTARCRHAAISPNAAAASSSMSTMRPMPISCATASPRRCTRRTWPCPDLLAPPHLAAQQPPPRFPALRAARRDGAARLQPGK